MRWFHKKDRERDLERELRSDLELEAAELREQGLSEDDARYAARRAFGNATLVKEDVRRTWGGRWLEDFFNDLRHTARQLRKSPGFAITAVLTLALGIGANTAIFTIINAVLLKSLPVRDAGTLVILGPARGSGSGTGIPDTGSFSLYSFDLYQHLRDTKVFAGLCAVQSTSETDVSVRRSGWSEPELAQARLISGNYFDVLGVDTALGRPISPSDDTPSAQPVAVVSFRYWKDKLGGDPSVIGSSISVGQTSFTIIGIAPPEFYAETLRPDPPALWLPLSADLPLNRERALLDKPNEHWLYLIGRLAPGVSRGQAQGRLTAVLHNWLLAREGPAISTDDRARISRSYIELTPETAKVLSDVALK